MKSVKRDAKLVPKGLGRAVGSGTKKIKVASRNGFNQKLSVS
jgi:hypothetical protein